MYDLIAIGLRIKKARKSKGMTQEEFACKIHMDACNVSRLENGKISIRGDTLILISEVLEMTTDYILLGIRRTETSAFTAILQGKSKDEIEFCIEILECILSNRFKIQKK